MKNRSVVMPLIGINIVVFVLQFVFTNITNTFVLFPSQILSRPWILITSMFLHGSGSHIFYNMYGLLIFGPLLEEKIGPKRFLSLYLISGILAGLGHVVLSKLIYGTAPPALGASGALMGIIGALIILMPDLRLLLFFAIPMPLWVAGILWAVIDFVGIFLPSNVANLAHLVGLGVGLLYGLYLKKQRGNYRKRFSHGTHMNRRDIESYLKSGRI